MVDSLELLEQPAVLYEYPSLRYVAANVSATREAERVFHARDVEHKTAADLLDLLGLDVGVVRKHVDSAAANYAKEVPYGVVYVTRMETSRELTRPDLLLTTLHPGTTRENAYMAHHRMLTLLRSNEAGWRAMRMMEDALLQMQAALSAQHVMMQEMNHRAAEFFRLEVGNFLVTRS